MFKVLQLSMEPVNHTLSISISKRLILEKFRFLIFEILQAIVGFLDAAFEKLELRKLQEDEAALSEKFKSIKPDEMTPVFMKWINDQIESQGALKIEIEKSLIELEAERNSIESCSTNPEKFKTHLKDIFTRLFKMEPARQKEFLREIFTKMEVFKDNRLKLTWKIPGDCDPGGKRFASSNEWGARWDLKSSARRRAAPPPPDHSNRFRSLPVRSASTGRRDSQGSNPPLRTHV